MKEISNKLKDAFFNSVDSIKEVADEAYDTSISKINEGLKAIWSIGDVANKKSITYVKNILDTIPLYEEAGYSAVDIEVGVSIPPSVELRFVKVKDIDVEEIKKIQAKYKDKEVFLMVLESLMLANSFQQAVSSDNLKSNEIAVLVTIPPKVLIKFQWDGSFKEIEKD